MNIIIFFLLGPGRQSAGVDTFIFPYRPTLSSLIIIIIINYIFPRSRPHPHLLVLFGLECGISWFCFVYYFLGSDQWLVLFPFCLLAIIDLHPSFTFGKRRSVAAFFCVFFPSPSRSSVVSSSRKKTRQTFPTFIFFSCSFISFAYSSSTFFDISRLKDTIYVEHFFPSKLIIRNFQKVFKKIFINNNNKFVPSERKLVFFNVFFCNGEFSSWSLFVRSLFCG